MKFEYLADIDNGVLKIRGRKSFDLDIKTCDWKVGKITLEKYKAKRSLNQNAYYHACIIPILQQGMADLGHKYSRETVHEMMKLKFLKEDVPVNDHGEFITRVKSTTELNKVQFGEYIDEITAWAAEYLGVTIPPANTQTTLI